MLLSRDIVLDWAGYHIMKRFLLLFLFVFLACNNYYRDQTSHVEYYDVGLFTMLTIYEHGKASSEISREYNKYFIDAAYNLTNYKGYTIILQKDLLNDKDSTTDKMREKLIQLIIRDKNNEPIKLDDSLFNLIKLSFGLKYIFIINGTGNYVSPAAISTTQALSSLGTLVMSGGALMIRITPLQGYSLNGILIDLETKEIKWQKTHRYVVEDPEEDGMIFINNGVKQLLSSLPGKKFTIQKEILE